MANNIIPTEELYSFTRENKIKISNNNAIQKVFNFSIIQNIKQKNKNLEKFFDEALYNSDPKESNKIQDIEDNIQKTLITNTKNNSFTDKFLTKKHISDSQFNNKIKVLKNNKLVYVNKDLLNSYSSSRAIKKLKKINFIIRKNRSSKYRGVSKNGNYWQVLIMINKKKFYLGNYPSEDLAARIYDIQAIKSRGIKARTNFVYDNNQMKKIYNNKININYDNISDIMTQLNN